MSTSPDTLYLLKADFLDPAQSDARYFCRECVEAAGLLAYYPALKHHVRVQYVDFPRPRPELAPLLGEDNQSCPVLVLGGEPSADLPPHLALRRAHGKAFIEGVENIEAYLSHVYGIGIAH